MSVLTHGHGQRFFSRGDLLLLAGNSQLASTPHITLWLFNIAMENCPFIDGLPIKNGDFPLLC